MSIDAKTGLKIDPTEKLDPARRKATFLLQDQPEVEGQSFQLFVRCPNCGGIVWAPGEADPHSWYSCASCGQNFRAP